MVYIGSRLMVMAQVKGESTFMTSMALMNANAVASVPSKRSHRTSLFWSMVMEERPFWLKARQTLTPTKAVRSSQKAMVVGSYFFTKTLLAEEKMAAQKAEAKERMMPILY